MVADQASCRNDMEHPFLGWHNGYSPSLVVSDTNVTPSLGQSQETSPTYSNRSNSYRIGSLPNFEALQNVQSKEAQLGCANPSAAQYLKAMSLANLPCDRSFSHPEGMTDAQLIDYLLTRPGNSGASLNPNVFHTKKRSGATNGFKGRSQGHQAGTLYKTELCRSWCENLTCRYGSKCQFAHGHAELRPIKRHPKYKTEICRTFAKQGRCPYGIRCRFIHMALPPLEDSNAGGACPELLPQLLPHQCTETDLMCSLDRYLNVSLPMHSGNNGNNGMIGHDAGNSGLAHLCNGNAPASIEHDHFTHIDPQLLVSRLEDLQLSNHLANPSGRHLPTVTSDYFNAEALATMDGWGKSELELAVAQEQQRLAILGTLSCYEQAGNLNINLK